MAGEAASKTNVVPFQQKIRDGNTQLTHSLDEWQKHAKRKTVLSEQQRQPWESPARFKDRTDPNSFEVWEKANGDQYPKRNKGISISG